MRARSLAVHEPTDREIVGSIRAFEATEPLSVRPLFWHERVRPRRAIDSAHTDWAAFLCQTGVLPMDPWRSRLADAYGSARVPRWVNDLCCVLRTLRRTYENGNLSPFTSDHAEAVRLVSRAVRAAQRAPAFRIALAAKCAELRAQMAANGGFVKVEGDCLVPLGRDVLTWLRSIDWSDARPGAVFR